MISPTLARHLKLGGTVVKAKRKLDDSGAVVEVKHKFGAERCEDDGFKFPSKKERRYYKKLKLLQEAGEVIFFLRQVPFHLPGNVKFVVDFVEFWASGAVRFVDVKGYKTEKYKTKKKIVEAIYPVEICEA